MFQNFPIVARIRAICQHPTYIYYREVPFLFFVVPYGTHFSFLKKLYGLFLSHL